MKRNLQKILLLAAVFLCAATGYAYDVAIDGIAYDLNETNKTASVTCWLVFCGVVIIMKYVNIQEI